MIRLGNTNTLPLLRRDEKVAGLMLSNLASFFCHSSSYPETPRVVI